MKASQRISSILGDGGDGWEVFLRARKMIADGITVTELTIGEHDIGTAAPILQEMHRSAMAGHTGYAAIPGTDTLRDAVAKRVTERTGVDTKRENVLITPGGQSALFAAHLAATDPGDTALFIAPYYATYPGTIRSASAIPITITAHAENGFLPSASDIEAQATGAKSLLINTPNNPTGVIYDRATLESLANTVKKHDLWLISDEVYDTQIWEGEHISPRSLPDMAKRTLVVGSMSKSHALTGSRCGWLIGPAEVIEHLTNLSTHTTYGVPGYIQDASTFALAQGTRFEAEIAEPFRRRRQLAQELLAKQNTVGMVPSQGAMYLMLDIRETGLGDMDFALQLLDQRRIAVMPGQSFGEAASGHIRVAMTIADDQFEAALSELLDFAASFAA